MRRISSLLLLAALALPQLLSAQGTSPRLLSRAFPRQDWEISDIGDVRFGRVAVVEALEGPHLELRRLLNQAPASPSSDMKGHTPPFDGNSLMVSDFARGNRTPLGGYFGTFQRMPSSALATVAQGTDQRRALELTCQNQSPGFCGLWIQLYDFEAPLNERSYLDARGFSTLSFWIRGRAGGENILLKVADGEWEQREDAVPLGEVTDYLASGRLDTEWQQAVVPLDRFPGNIRRDLLAQVVFEVLGPGATSIEVGPMAFSLSPDPLPALPGPAEASQPSGPLRKATWVWNTAELLHAPPQMDSLLDFLEGEGFDHVFLQLPGIPDQPSEPGELAMDVEAVRPVVAAFNARGIRVYALDGFARYALPEFHAGVLRTIDHVTRYNRGVPPKERFYGVRYDIEPYLLPAFHGPGRSSLLQGLLDLTAASVERAHGAGLVFGADIPFWYDALSEETSERITVSFGGMEKAVSEHIIDLVDDVAIMDYRTVAYGADGTIRHGRGELEYAEKQGKAVFVGLETHPVPDEALLDFWGEPGVGLPESLPPGPVVVLGSGPDSIFVALLPGPATSQAFAETLAGWLDQNGLRKDDIWWWPMGNRVDVPAGKITFADLDPPDLERVMRDTAREFRQYESFVGFAIHHAESFRNLIQRQMFNPGTFLPLLRPRRRSDPAFPPCGECRSQTGFQPPL